VFLGNKANPGVGIIAEGLMGGCSTAAKRFVCALKHGFTLITQHSV
jgi:hypothetical protein